MDIAQDEHGQPVTSRLRNAAIQTRNIDELIGICRGVVFDKQVSQSEAEELYAWLHAQPELLDVWPANVVYARLKDALDDGVLDQSEASEMLRLLRGVIGDARKVETVDTETGEYTPESAPTSLPVTEPPLVFKGRSYVLTGKFATGSRKECEAEITSRGGVCQKSPVRATDYVVIGSVGSRDWAHSSMGRKIQKAVTMKEGGHHVEIVSEEHWASFIS